MMRQRFGSRLAISSSPSRTRSWKSTPMPSGQTIGALVRMVRHAGAELVGIGALIEKAFEGGRAELEPLGVPLHALAVISEMSDSHIVFAE